MDPTHLLGLLSIAINKHEKLKKEIKMMEKRCDHLKRVGLLWNSFFKDGGHERDESREISESIYVDEKVTSPAEVTTGNADENNVDNNSTSSNNKLNRISKRLKRILSNRTEDHSRTNQRKEKDSKNSLKVVNKNFSRTNSEGDSSKILSLSLSPSLFLVSEISKQMCGHYGMKLEDIHQMKTSTKGKERKSTSLSIDTHSKLFKCSRRASCDVVTSSDHRSPGGQNIRQSRSPSLDPPSKRQASSGFPETLKCALMQTNALLPVFPASSPSSSSSSRPQFPLCTLHEEMVSQWLGGGDDGGDHRDRSTLKVSNDDVFHQTADDDDVSRRSRDVPDSFSDSRSLPGDVKGCRDELELCSTVTSRDLKSRNDLLVAEDGKYDVMWRSFEGGSNRDKSENFLPSEPKNNINQRRHSYETPADLNFKSKGCNATKDINSSILSTKDINSNQNLLSTQNSIEEIDEQMSIQIPTKFIKLNECEETNRFTRQITNLKEQLKIMNLKISFLNDLLNSRLSWMENLHMRCNFSSPHVFMELRFLRQIFKAHVDELLRGLNQKLEPDGDDDDQMRLKELEEMLHSYHGDALSTKFLVVCISRLLDMFHQKFQQMKRCLNRKDLILQSLESNLLLQEVTNKLIKSRRKRKLTNESVFENKENIVEISKEIQQEDEHNCINGTELFESEMKIILSRVDKKSYQRQLAQEKSPTDEDEVSITNDKSSTNLKDLIINENLPENNSNTKIEESIKSADSSVTGTTEPTCSGEDAKGEKTSSRQQKKRSEGDDVYEFSLDDLLMGRENISKNSKRYLETRHHRHDGFSGKKHSISIFRPSVKKSDWVIREARLPYFEIKSYSSKNNPSMSSSWMEESKQEKVKANIPIKLQHSSCPVETYEDPKDCLSSTSLNLSQTLKKSDPIKELYDDIPSRPERSRSERNSFDMWTCVDGYNRSPQPERCDRGSKRSNESSKSSKSFLNKISPNKSPLNICKNLCLVNGQSSSFDDGTK